MTLIEVLSDYYKLTKEDEEDYICSSCPCDFDIFEDYEQGSLDWCYSYGCRECWETKPIKI